MVNEAKFMARICDIGRTLFTMSVMGFLTTTESQDLGLTSHPKDGLKNVHLRGSCFGETW